MDNWPQASYTAFEGCRRIASGEMAQVALKAKEAFDRGGRSPVLVFDDHTGQQVEVDFRGTARDLVRRLEAAAGAATPDHPDREARRGPGRPKLGVVAREVTLLPR